MLTHKLCNSKFIFSSRLLDTFALFFLRIWSLNFLWSNTPSFSSHCWSPLPLLTFSSLLLPATTKMTIRPLKKKTLLHISTYHCKTQIWALKFDCLRLLLEGLQFLACYFLDSTLSIYAFSKKKKKKTIYKDYIIWVLPLSLFFYLQYSHQTRTIFPCITSTGIQNHDWPPNLCPILSITLLKKKLFLAKMVIDRELTAKLAVSKGWLR